MSEVFDGFLLVISLPKSNSMFATCVISDMYVRLPTRGSYAVWLLSYLNHQIDTKYSPRKRINVLLKRNIRIDQMIREQAGITQLQASYHTLPTTDVCMYLAMMSIMSIISKCPRLSKTLQAFTGIRVRPHSSHYCLGMRPSKPGPSYGKLIYFDAAITKSKSNCGRRLRDQLFVSKNFNLPLHQLSDEPRGLDPVLSHLLCMKIAARQTRPQLLISCMPFITYIPRCVHRKISCTRSIALPTSSATTTNLESESLIEYVLRTRNVRLATDDVYRHCIA